jgi:hypothetical protein
MGLLPRRQFLPTAVDYPASSRMDHICMSTSVVTAPGGATGSVDLRDLGNRLVMPERR